MYFTQLPDHSAPGFDEQAHFSRFKRQNMIFNAFSRQSYCPAHVGCLSLKTIYSGEEWFGIDNRRLAVRPGQFLILNDDQGYSSQIHRGEGARVLSIFFQKEFASSVFRDMLHPEEALINDPFSSDGQTLEFFQTLHAVGPDLHSRLSALVVGLETNGYDRSRTDEHLVFLLRYLVRAYRSDANLLQKVNAVKPATKKEIFKRLCVARDILHSSFQDPLDLSQLSAHACLSMPQLIRQFKSVFLLTPHQYLVAIRLQQAAHWLNTTSLPVREITWRCGFNDSSAFCRAFKSAFGLSPNGYRMISAVNSSSLIFPSTTETKYG